MTGIYFLLNRNRVVYIGATNRYPSRIKQHPDKVFTAHRFIGCSRDMLASYERRLIALFKPKYNKSNGSVRTHKALVIPSEKVILVGFYTKKRIIDSVGGMESARALAKNYIESKAEADEVGRMAMHG